MAVNVTYTGTDDKSYTVSVNAYGINSNYSTGIIKSTSILNKAISGNTLSFSFVEYEGFIIVRFPSGGSLLYKISIVNKVTSNAKYKIMIGTLIYSKSNSWSLLIDMGNADVAYPKNLEECKKILITGISPNIEMEAVNLSGAIEYLLEEVLTYHNVPIYKNNTLISYTDSSYEVIDDVLTEDKAKSHAYKNLLETYGSFYKATETHMNETLKKMSS